MLGAGLRTAVTIARSLHRQNIPVIVAPVTPAEPAIQSRAIQKHVRLPDFRARRDDFIRELTALIQTEGIDMIMPTGDGAMAAVAQHYETLANLAHVGSPSPAVMERVLNKDLTLAAAQKCGIPIAASRLIEDPSEIATRIEGLQYPLIAKPTVRDGKNSYRIKYFITAKDLFNSIAKDDEWLRGALLQEYVPGVGKGIGVLMHKGAPMAMFQHRRVKEFPYTGGVSVTAEAEKIDPVLGDLAVALLREIEWQGIAMVEYRYNPADNRFVFMEINGRYWGSLFLAARAGIDFPYYEWQLAHGEQPNIPKTYAAGSRARWLAGDISRLHSILDQSHRSEIDPVSRGKEIMRFVTDFGFRTRDAVFSFNDPMPGIQELRETVAVLAKADLKYLIAGMLPKALLKQIRIYRNLESRLRPIFVNQQLRRLARIQPVLFRRNANEIHSVLFVCLGNIIRSATAAMFMQKMLADTDRKSLEIFSAGLWEGLNRVNPRPSPEVVTEIAAEWGISLKEHRSRPVTRNLIDACDTIFVMDYQNESMLLSQYPDARHKVFLLGACVENVPLGELEIADPYGGTHDEIRACVSAINDRVQRLARILTSHGKAK